MKFDLPPLPYKTGELAPHISERTVSIHYTKHDQGYVDKLNEIAEVQGSPEVPLEDLILTASLAKAKTPVDILPPKPVPSHLIDMASQVYNHTFYWRSMRPKGGGDPVGEIAKGVEKDFGTPDKFREAIKQAGLKLFGSGWVWVALDTSSDAGELRILRGQNAAIPWLWKGMVPLLTIDVWEHAYYLDYQEDRGAYLDAVINHLLNWDFANENLEHI